MAISKTYAHVLPPLPARPALPYASNRFKLISGYKLLMDLPLPLILGLSTLLLSLPSYVSPAATPILVASLLILTCSISPLATSLGLRKNDSIDRAIKGGAWPKLSEDGGPPEYAVLMIGAR